MATSTDIHAYRILADHFEYVCRSSGRKKDASPEVISLQMLISKVNSAFVTAGRAVRTENERLYVLEIKDRVEALVAGKAVPITDPMRFLEMAVLEGDPEGALEYFQGLQGITKNLAFEYLCKYYGPIQGNLIEDGTEHLKKDPISALLFADQKSIPLYVYLKKIEEGLVTETLAKNPQIAGIDRVEVMNETLAVLERGSYVSPMGVVHQLKRDAMIKAAKSVKVYQSGGEDAQRMGSKPTQIIVKNLDCLYAAKEFYDLGYNPIVLNMANPKHPGGGYRKGARAQEEDLFRRTDLSYLLDTECNVQEVNFYPLNKKSESVGLYVPKTVVFRAGKDKRYAFLNKSYEVAVAVIAALLNPPTRTVNGKPRLSNTNAEITFEKVCTVLEMAFEEGHQVVILGAFGCGAFRNPPDHVSEIFMDTILKRYAHCFECIVFAITEDSNSRENNDEGNFIPFARRAIKAGGKAFNAQGQEVTFKQ